METDITPEIMAQLQKSCRWFKSNHVQMIVGRFYITGTRLLSWAIFWAQLGIN